MTEPTDDMGFNNTIRIVYANHYFIRFLLLILKADSCYSLIDKNKLSGAWELTYRVANSG